jgi:hypothetical protein
MLGNIISNYYIYFLRKYLKTHMMAKLNTEEEVLEIYKKHH